MKSQAQNSMTERFLKNDPDVLYEMKGMIEELVNHPGWMFVMDILDTRIAEARLLMETGLKEQAEYTGFIGEIRGMGIARAAADAVLEAARIGEERNRNFVAQMAAGEADHG